MRPDSVARAIRLLWLYLGVRVAGFASDALRQWLNGSLQTAAAQMKDKDDAALVFLAPFVTIAVFAGFYSFLNSKISSGRNWARLLALAIFILSFISEIRISITKGLPALFPMTMWLLESTFYCAALWCLFRK